MKYQIDKIRESERANQNRNFCNAVALFIFWCLDKITDGIWLDDLLFCSKFGSTSEYPSTYRDLEKSLENANIYISA